MQKQKYKHFGLRRQREWGGGDTEMCISETSCLQTAVACRYETSLRIYRSTRRQIAKNSNGNGFMRLRIGQVGLLIAF
jgi:hypothetical protein